MGNQNYGRGERDPGLEREHRRQEDRAWSPTSRSQSQARGLYQDKQETRGFYDQSSGQRLSGTGTDASPARTGSNSISHRGKGPKGYSRSDERIREDVCDRLSDDARLDASDIEVAVDRGEVTLSGEVANRDAKRRAEDVTEQCSGVRDVHNRIRVRSENSGARASSETARNAS